MKAIKKLTNGVGVDVSIECSGNQQAQNDALDCTRELGEVGLIGESKKCTINPNDQFIRKLLDVKGCWYFNRAEWSEIMDFMISKKVDIEKISSHTFPLNRLRLFGFLIRMLPKK
ncbi:MAG: zinc-binding dehydrogenase [Candidatus Humimicrobiaceae bacterium]